MLDIVTMAMPPGVLLPTAVASVVRVEALRRGAHAMRR